ncbi:hypothetical protein Godav_025240 [Gossypium davidsonii]|uniref:Retrotransposon gag domain-containing protein n=2 Tax=Gossypium TaxID=3633 RepID=A0A7J8THZ9_GOSDV|nr:hypothetical protein [Gossypium davidsonii]MBA0673311.1 hypothetical protein [Gossypium klotzschianum]
MDKVNNLLNSYRDKLTERNDTLEAMVMALKEETMVTTKALNTRIEELEGELALCQVIVENGVPSVALNCKFILKPKEFTETRSAYDVDNFLWRTENYFRHHGRCEFTEKEARAKLRWLTQWGTVEEYVREFKKFMLQILDVTEKEVLLASNNGLKPWVK